MNYISLFLILLISFTGCSSAKFKPGDFVESKITGEQYLVINYTSQSQGKSYYLRNWLTDSSDNKYEMELTPTIPVDKTSVPAKFATGTIVKHKTTGKLWLIQDSNLYFKDRFLKFKYSVASLDDYRTTQFIEAELEAMGEKE